MSNNKSAAEALELLKEGNKRFVSNQMEHPHGDAQWKSSLVGGQSPFAVVVTCSDSRVSPELIFDQGLGDLFVIRVAGNIVDDHALGTIEYAVAHLGSKLIVVMGHESCGAVGASLGTELPGGHINSLVEQIRPAVLAVQEMEGDLLTNAVKENARMVARKIQDTDPFIKPAVSEEGVEIVSSYYRLSDGVAEFI